MPVYEYYCDNCRRDVSVTLSIGEHDKATAACPQCGNTTLRPLVSRFDPIRTQLVHSPAATQ